MLLNNIFTCELFYFYETFKKSYLMFFEYRVRQETSTGENSRMPDSHMSSGSLKPSDRIHLNPSAEIVAAAMTVLEN
jgi:hypothetical protein